jgi:DNA-directed RNA polymerase subunit RPC12/RpoP
VFRIGTTSASVEQATPTKPASTRSDQTEQAAADSLAGASGAPLHPELEERPAWTSFSCSLCQTHMTAPSTDAGRKVKCPDCGRVNVVPPPPPPKPKRVPAAMEGPQYELMPPNLSLPLPPPRTKSGGIPPAGAALHPVHCLKCGTLMYARDEHLGKKLRCPDCGGLTLARPREIPTAPPSLLAPGGEEYQLEEAPLLPRLASVSVAVAEAQAHEAARVTGEEMAGGRRRAADEPIRRPKLPRNPLLQGVGPMLRTQEIVARWVLLSLVAGLAGQCVTDALMGPSGGLAGFVGIALTIATFLLGGLWLTMAGPLVLAIIGESAEGNDRLNDPPAWTSFDWFAETFSVFTAISVAGVLGLGAWKLAELGELPTEARAAITGVVVALALPIGLLSVLLEGSPVGVISPRLLSTLPRCAGPWLLFYVETMLLAAAVGGLAWLLAANRASGAALVSLVWGLPPVATAALLAWARLMGRLAWWISEKTAEEESGKVEG